MIGGAEKTEYKIEHISSIKDANTLVLCHGNIDTNEYQNDIPIWKHKLGLGADYHNQDLLQSILKSLNRNIKYITLDLNQSNKPDIIGDIFNLHNNPNFINKQFNNIIFMNCTPFEYKLVINKIMEFKIAKSNPTIVITNFFDLEKRYLTNLLNKITENKVTTNNLIKSMIKENISLINSIYIYIISLQNNKIYNIYDSNKFKSDIFKLLFNIFYNDNKTLLKISLRSRFHFIHGNIKISYIPQKIYKGLTPSGQLDYAYVGPYNGIILNY